MIDRNIAHKTKDMVKRVKEPNEGVPYVGRWLKPLGVGKTGCSQLIESHTSTEAVGSGSEVGNLAIWHNWNYGE